VTRGLVSLIVLTAIAIATAVASASTRLPVSPIFLGATHAHDGLQIKPATITYTGDGTGFLGAASARSPNAGIQWTKWTTGVALGTGFNQLNNCDPSCAGGTYRGYPVKIELWRARTVAHTVIFTRMTIYYNKQPPKGEPRHYTFTDTHTGGTLGGFGWGPPSQQGYCANTHGLKPEAVCKNIHTLP
jgi:hypothetical protein